MVDYIYAKIYDTLRTLKVTEVFELVARFYRCDFRSVAKSENQVRCENHNKSNSGCNVAR